MDNRSHIFPTLGSGLLLAIATHHAVASTDLDQLSLESLMSEDVQITSAMKRAQSASETAASIYVLDNKSIMSSGATSVAEALKLVPGMQVRQIDNNQWAIGIRAIAGRYSSKLLVMLDGQSLYNPSFAGVYWETVDIPLNDVERIEVIRGQGGTLWGSNATSGVINIITKQAMDSRGGYIQASSGNTLSHQLDARYGSSYGTSSAFRFFMRSKEHTRSDIGHRAPAHDAGESLSFGARADFSFNDDLSLLMQANYIDIDNEQMLSFPDLELHRAAYLENRHTRTRINGMARLEHRLSPRANQMVQLSLSSEEGDQLYYSEDSSFIDIDYQMNSLLGNSQLDWGLNYRYNDIVINQSDYITSTNGTDALTLYGAFFQIQYPLMANVNLIVGNKAEHNSFSGWEHQPSARLIMDLSPHHTTWLALSRGVRIPSFVEYDYQMHVGGTEIGALYSTNVPELDAYPIDIFVLGSEDAEAEQSSSSELGYRYNKAEWTMDLSLHHTVTQHALAVNPRIEGLQTELIAPLLYARDYGAIQQLLDNVSLVNHLNTSGELRTRGGELVVGWHPAKQFCAELGYSYLSHNYSLKPDTYAAIGRDGSGQQLMLKTSYQPRSDIAIHSTLRRETGNLYHTEDFTVLDLAMNWQVSNSITVSAATKNLLFGAHLEYSNTAETFTEPSHVDQQYQLGLAMTF